MPGPATTGVIMRLILATLLLSVATVAQAQPLAFTRLDQASAGAPRAIATADFNRDGWIDIATAGTGRDSVGIHLSRGRAGGFAAVIGIVAGGGPFDMAAGDLNNDAIPDLAIANADLDTVTILLGNGDGTFQPKRDLPMPGNPRGLALADHDHDGTLDVFATQFGANSWTVLYGDGTGGVRAQATFAAGIQPQGIAAADFNNDGVVDVVVVNAGSALTAYMSNGPMTWTGGPVAGSGSGNVLATGDFNRDGRLDLVTASTFDSRLVVYLGSATGLALSTSRITGSSPR